MKTRDEAGLPLWRRFVVDLSIGVAALLLALAVGTPERALQLLAIAGALIVASLLLEPAAVDQADPGAARTGVVPMRRLFAIH